MTLHGASAFQGLSLRSFRRQSRALRDAHNATALRQQAELIRQMMDEGALDLAMLVAGHVQERVFRPDAPVLLDIFTEMFATLRPDQLLDAEKKEVERQAQDEQRKQEVLRERNRRQGAGQHRVSNRVRLPRSPALDVPCTRRAPAAPALALHESSSPPTALPLHLSCQALPLSATIRPIMARSSRYRQTLVQRHDDSTHAQFMLSIEDGKKAVELNPELHTKVCVAGNS